MSSSRSWHADCAVRYKEANNIEKKEISRDKQTRRSAGRIVFYLIMSLLSDGVKQLVEADADFRVQDSLQDKSPFQLLAIVKRIVTTGITSDSTYQCVVNMRNLTAMTQKPTESVRQFADRVKAAADVFSSTSPFGLIFTETDMLYRRPAKRNKQLSGTPGLGGAWTS